MTVLWVGHEADCYVLNNANNVENSAAAAHDASYERTGMKSGRAGSGNLRSTPDWAATDEIWHRFNLLAGGYSVGMVLWGAMNVAGTILAQIVAATSGTAQFQVWNGAAFVNVGAAFALVGNNVKGRADVHMKGGAAGLVEVYYGTPGSQTLVVNAAASYASVINLVRIYHGCSANAVTDTTVADEIVQTTSTLSSTSETKPPTSNGTDVNGTGTWADVDETPYNDVDVVTLGASGQHQSFKAAARTQTQAVVTGITASCRAWYEAGGPSQLKPYLTIGGLRYYGTTFNLALTAAGYQYTWLINPATGVAFTTAEGNAATLEWGWEAV